MCEVWRCRRSGTGEPAATPVTAPDELSSTRSAPGAAGMTDNAASALCYALGIITGVLFLVLPPYNQNKTVRFHAFQSIFLFVALVIVAIAVGILDTMISSIVGWWFAFAIGRIFNLACIVLWVYMIVTTYQGRSPALPIIGPLAQQQA